MAEWSIEPLAKTHERGEFSCGKVSLDNFLRSLVSQYEKRRLGRTYVAVRSREKRVFGYYTLATGAIPFENLPAEATKKLPRHPVPVILLARLAVDRSVQGQGLGGYLMGDALRRCLSLSRQLGVHAVEVDALDEHARAFYQRYSFSPLVDNLFHLYLPMTTIEAAFKDEENAE
jgi:GNAT superfamily N-acetyltransferase